MANDVIYKRPGETIPYFFDFAGIVASGDTSLSNTTVTGKKTDGTTDNTVVSSSSASGLKLTAILTAGTDGEDYTITFSAKGSPSTNGPWERTLEMRVRAGIGIGHL